jgi:Uma2 family endonuclease
VADPARRRATYEDLLGVPDRLVAEIVAGELVAQPRPAPRHALAGSALSAQLGPPFSFGHGGPGGWWILYEPELHLADGDVLVPDIAGWRVERLPALPDTPYFELAPDWVCEVLSSSSAARDRTDKMSIYAGAGVGFIWLVDPAVRTLECYRLENRRWLLLGSLKESERARVEPFEAVELELERLWLGPLRA